MKKMLTAVLVFVMGLSMSFGLTASANPVTVNYGYSFNHSLSSGQTYTYNLPNARTSGTSVKITTSVANVLRLHYYWSYNNALVDLGTAIVNKTNYSGGASYYQTGTLVTVVERVPGSTTPYPVIAYTISFN
ncbi:hypothetical protein R70723_03430 [Paenibacillus sp. FSL R7-0273]|uniref:hypothetical protein n=1 Tax=Paenibacillus sp. FSL R7-0273 TaxID=1536772 RepID=UPI0004F72C9F|nr:hypothetical protein [Paenibacillus sp. FSL R7-0273]AIQ45061.1 hypothetical protein R70723_03430 [Paenibacillus sp. FSL R7-0273]OMF84102.1 hypothetical protein BK144_30795 [Paenibacillus sp. FSL R7-0273]